MSTEGDREPRVSNAGAISELSALQARVDRNAHGHIAQALRLRLLNDAATFVTTIGGASATALSALLISAQAKLDPVTVSIFAISGTITLVGVWQAVWQPGSRSDRHKSWATEFSSIEDDCRLLACGQVETTLAQLMSKATDVSRSADLVPESLWRQRRQRSGK